MSNVDDSLAIYGCVCMSQTESRNDWKIDLSVVLRILDTFLPCIINDDDEVIPNNSNTSL